MNKQNFGTLVAFVSRLLNEGYTQLTQAHIETLDVITDEPPVVKVVPSEFMTLAQRAHLFLFIRALADNNFIEAIREHRTLTGLELKESKDAVEALRSEFNFSRRG